jgi:hypothetical protein
VEKRVVGGHVEGLSELVGHTRPSSSEFVEARGVVGVGDGGRAVIC